MQIVLAHEREVTQVTLVVVVVVTTRVETRVSQLLVVAETEDSEIGQVDLAISRKVDTHDDDDNALDGNTAGRNRHNDLTLNGKIETARNDTATTGDTAGNGGLAIAVRERVGYNRIGAQAQLLGRITGLQPVIAPRYTGNANATGVLDLDPDVVGARSATIANELEIALRTDGHSHTTAARAPVAQTVVHIARVRCGCEDKQQREKQNFSFEHRLNLLNLLKGSGT